MDRHAVPAHSFFVPARSFGSGRAPGPLRTKPLRVLLHVHCDVFARYRANGSSRRTFSASVVLAVRRTICATRHRRSLCAPTWLRSVFCGVSAKHARYVGMRVFEAFGWNLYVLLWNYFPSRA